VRVLLTVLAAILYALGWLAGKVWAALVWVGTAVQVGFQDATRRTATAAPAPMGEKVRVPAYPAPGAEAA
jgi:hypothetical protein